MSLLMLWMTSAPVTYATMRWEIWWVLSCRIMRSRRHQTAIWSMWSTNSPTQRKKFFRFTSVIAISWSIGRELFCILSMKAYSWPQSRIMLSYPVSQSRASLSSNSTHSLKQLWHIWITGPISACLKERAKRLPAKICTMNCFEFGHSIRATIVTRRRAASAYD